MDRTPAEQQRIDRQARIDSLLAATSLVALVGSEKQIAWATKIREGKLEHVARCLAVNLERNRYLEEIELQQKVLAWIAKIEDSSWWIQVKDAFLDAPDFWKFERKYPLPK